MATVYEKNIPSYLFPCKLPILRDDVETHGLSSDNNCSGPNAPLIPYRNSNLNGSALHPPSKDIFKRKRLPQCDADPYSVVTVTVVNKQLVAFGTRLPDGFVSNLIGVDTRFSDGNHAASSWPHQFPQPPRWAQGCLALRSSLCNTIRG